MSQPTLDLSFVWQNTLQAFYQAKKIDESGTLFYKDTQLHSLTPEKAIIVTATSITRMILLQDLSLIQSSLQEVLQLDHPLSCEIIDQNNLDKMMLFQKEDEIDDIPYFNGIDLSRDKTFENFVVGKCNEESYQAAQFCSINPGKSFNPLFIYGNPGIGKSHLLQAIGNRILANDPTKKIYYTNPDNFVSAISEAIKNDTIDKFKRYLNHQDVFLMDDVQFLRSKNKTMEVFFNVFNELVNNRKQICIVSDCPPAELRGLEERLISRFSSGLSLCINNPEYETALKILKMKINNSMREKDNYMCDFDDEALAYIASHCNKDVRNLEGALNQVLFYTIQFPKGDIINLEIVEQALKGRSVAESSSGGTVTAARIKKIICNYYGLTKTQLEGKSRTRKIADARQIAMYFCRTLLDLPYIKIGEEFGGRDHSTVINACDKIEKQLKIDNSPYKLAVLEIEKMIKS